MEKYTKTSENHNIYKWFLTTNTGLIQFSPVMKIYSKQQRINSLSPKIWCFWENCCIGIITVKFSLNMQKYGGSEKKKWSLEYMITDGLSNSFVLCSNHSKHLTILCSKHSNSLYLLYSCYVYVLCKKSVVFCIHCKLENLCHHSEVGDAYLLTWYRFRRLNVG